MSDIQHTPQTLEVYLLDKHIGRLYSDRAVLSFVYDSKYLEEPDATALSGSLPLQKEPFEHAVTAAFFSNLLPEGNARKNIARYLKVSDKNTFELLKEIGGECAGAVSVYPSRTSPHTTQSATYKVLNDDEADEVLSSLDKRPMMVGEEDIRISGAGAQEKLLIAFVDGKVAIPTGTTPSTHIIKPMIKGLDETVQNEFFCMRLAKMVGLPVPNVEIYWLKNKPYYLIERYDRIKDEQGFIKRLHQEDFCQAMKFPPEIKYQNEQGPSLEDCFNLLDKRIQSGAMSGKNKLTFLQGVIFNFIIGNGDAHGKNFSILYEGQSERLAPFYDLLSTVIYNDTKMAMKIGGKYKFKEVATRHWDRLGEAIGFKSDFIRRQMLILSNDVAKASTKLFSELNQDPQTASPIYEKIMGVIILHHRKTSQVASD